MPCFASERSSRSTKAALLLKNTPRPTREHGGSYLMVSWTDHQWYASVSSYLPMRTRLSDPRLPLADVSSLGHHSSLPQPLIAFKSPSMGPERLRPQLQPIRGMQGSVCANPRPRRAASHRSRQFMIVWQEHWWSRDFLIWHRHVITAIIQSDRLIPQHLCWMKRSFTGATHSPSHHPQLNC